MNLLHPVKRALVEEGSQLNQWLHFSELGCRLSLYEHSLLFLCLYVSLDLTSGELAGGKRWRYSLSKMRIFHLSIKMEEMTKDRIVNACAGLAPTTFGFTYFQKSPPSTTSYPEK
jgi:hypothetical protein